MSKQASRARRVPPSRNAIRVALSAREIDRELSRYRPVTASAARSLEV